MTAVKKFALLLAVLAAAFLNSGCFLTADPAELLDFSDGKLLGIQIPEAVQARGREAVRSYVVAQYPAAAPFVDAALDRVFPESKIGPPSFVQVPIIRTTNLTIQLKDGISVNGSRFVGGDQISSIYVEVVSKLGEPVLPAPQTATYTPGQFAASVIGAPAPVPAPEPEDTIGPDAPAPSDDGLEPNPSLPAE